MAAMAKEARSTESQNPELHTCSKFLNTGVVYVGGASRSWLTVYTAASTSSVPTQFAELIGILGAPSRGCSFGRLFSAMTVSVATVLSERLPRIYAAGAGIAAMFLQKVVKA